MKSKNRLTYAELERALADERAENERLRQTDETKTAIISKMMTDGAALLKTGDREAAQLIREKTAADMLYFAHTLLNIGSIFAYIHGLVVGGNSEAGRKSAKNAAGELGKHIVYLDQALVYLKSSSGIIIQADIQPVLESAAKWIRLLNDWSGKVQHSEVELNRLRRQIETDINDPVLSRFLNQARIKAKMQPETLERINQFIELRRKGLSYTQAVEELAKRHNVTTGTIMKMIDRNKDLDLLDT